MSDKQTIGVYDAQAETYLDFIDQVEEDKILKKFSEQLPDSARVLDLGCGPALSSVQMRNYGIDVDPVDASAAMVKLANERFAIGARQASFADIQVQNEYHGVWANFSLLHASKEEFVDVLMRLYSALKADGILNIAMKIGSGCKRDNLGRLYSYYTQQELVELLDAAGFTIERIEEGEDEGLAGDVEAWISLCCTSNK